MKVKIIFEGDEPGVSQVRESVKLMLEQEAEDAVEYEHDTGNMTTISTTVDGPDGSLVIEFEEPEEDEDE